MSFIDDLRKNPAAVFAAGFGATLVAGTAAAVIGAAQPDGVAAYVKAANGIPGAVPDKTASQVFMAERVLGAGHGMRAWFWSNPDLERRLDALELEQRMQAAASMQSPELREELRDVWERGFDEGLGGKWTEDALDGYLTAVEMSRAEMDDLHAAARSADPSEAFSPSIAAAELAADLGSAGSAPYFAQAAESLLETEEVMFGYIADRVDTQNLYGTTPIRAAVANVGTMQMLPDDLAQASDAARIVLDAPEQQASIDPAGVAVEDGQAVTLDTPSQAVSLDDETHRVRLAQDSIAIESPFDQEPVAVSLERQQIPITLEAEKQAIVFDASYVTQDVEDPFADAPEAAADIEADLDR